METLLTQIQALEATGWHFTSLRNHKRAEAYPGTAPGAYVVEEPADADIAVTATAYADPRDVGEAVVILDPAIAETFSSIRLLLPGDPLFASLVSLTTNQADQTVVYVCGTSAASETDPISVETDSEATADADVVLPATTEDRSADLPTGGSLPSVPEAKQTVRAWVAG